MHILFSQRNLFMKKSSFTLLVLGTLSNVSAFAQSTPSSTLTPVTVTGNPLGATDLIAPAAQYSGTELLLRSQTTLGETLDGTPGVSSTYFGPNASRPIIRGLDGDRVRVLNNGGSVTDVSSVSYDHAVTADPLSVEKVEVLRGPGALLYGGNAVGGVVNVLDSRIAREPLFDAKGGITGKADLGMATGNGERSAAIMLDGGDDRFALHADAFHRTTNDVAVPDDLACSKPGAPAAARAICNSASDTRGAAVGGTVFFQRGYLGASASQFVSNYGTVAEDDVTIDMRSERYAIDGALNGLKGPLQSVKLHLGQSDYRHTELEGSETGTVFKSSGHDLRLEARHAPWAGFDGMVGLQVETANFSASGEEAFAPYSQTRQAAAFAYEEKTFGWGRLSGGVRMEQVDVQSYGNPDVDRFVVGTRSFTPGSYALGALLNVAPGWQLTSNLAYSERAPKDYELFANGPHVATHAFEIGDPGLRLEQSTNLDVGAQWKKGANKFSVSAFANRFDNYITQVATGAQQDDMDVYAFKQVKAQFTGLEASGNVRLLEGAQTLDLELRGDAVRARNSDTSEALPRIAPVRVGAALNWAQGKWTARLAASHSAAQTDVPAGQRGTDAFTIWNAAAGYTTKVGGTQMQWLFKLENITDALAYSASSVLTQTVPGKAPLPGRTFKLNLRCNF